MSINLEEDQREVNKALAYLEEIIKRLEVTNNCLTDQNFKRRTLNIKKQVSMLKTDVQSNELRYRQAAKHKEMKRRMVADDIAFRTNYNRNTDGRIQGAYYSGPGDIRKKNKKSYLGDKAAPSLRRSPVLKF